MADIKRFKAPHLYIHSVGFDPYANCYEVVMASDYDAVVKRINQLTVLLNLADHYLQATSFNSVGDVVEHTEAAREEFRATIADVLTRQEPAT